MSTGSLSKIAINTGKGDGYFTREDDVSDGGRSDLVVADFNGDDHADLASSVDLFGFLRVSLNQDTTPAAAPVCTMTSTIAGPPKQIVLNASDLGSGVKSIVTTTLENATVRIERFASLGALAPGVRIVVTKVDQLKPAKVAFVVTDGFGKQASCY